MLPNSWTTAHYLTQLSDDDFAKVKDSISPNATKMSYLKILEDEVKRQYLHTLIL